jgi:hypothetical protein
MPKVIRIQQLSGMEALICRDALANRCLSPFSPRKRHEQNGTCDPATSEFHAMDMFHKL